MKKVKKNSPKDTSLLFQSGQEKIELKEQNNTIQIVDEETETKASLFDFVPSAFFTLDQNATICRMNQRGAFMLKEERSDLVNSNFSLFIDLDSLPDFNVFFRKTFETNCQQTCEVRLRINGNLSNYVRLEGIVPNEKTECHLTAFDITESKLAEGKLQENMQLFQGLFNVSPDAIILIDPHHPTISWPIVDCNKSACEMNGYSRSELVGHSIDILNVTEGSKEERISYFEELRKKGTIRKEVYHRRKDGSIFAIEVLSSIVTLGGREIVLGIDRDITERKSIEKALRESEYFFKQSQRAANIGSYKFDLVNNFWESSEVLDQILGIESITNKDLRIWQDLLHPDNKEMMDQYFSDEVITKRKPFNKEYKIIRKSDGETRWVHGLGELDFDAGNNLISMFGTIQDITERKMAEEVSREAEERFRMVFENVFDGICIYDENPDPFKRKLIECNEQYAIMSGFSREELLRNGYTQELQITLQDSANEIRLESLSEKKAYSGSYSWIRPDGKDNIIEYIGVPVIWRGKSFSIGIDRDITYRKRAEEALRESSELNNSLLQTIPFGMDIIDEEGNILFLSENLERLFGDKAIGLKCWDLYCDNKSQCTECPLLSGINIGKTALYETQGVLGGKTFQISHTGMLFKGKKAMLEIFQDITEKKEVEKKVKLLAHSLESIAECVSIADIDDHILYVNESFIKTYGYSENELIGKHISYLLPPDIKKEEVKDIFPKTITGGWRGEIMNKRKDGTVFPILLSTSAIKDENEKPIALIGVAIDITEMRKNREELIAAKEKAEESDRLKSTFLANMSHEIRTPLNSIVGFSELMTDPDYDTAQQFRFARMINESGNNLLIIISDIMEISKIEAGEISIKKRIFSVNQLVGDIQKEYRFKAITKGIELRLDRSNPETEIFIESDEAKIRQVIVNFVSNSVKFTNEGFIVIGFKIDGNLVQFHVKDTGIGISKEFHEQIFKRFSQIESVYTRKYGGNGLGLAISKGLVELLGGTIWMKSEQGKGSSFYFTIPKN